MNWISGIAVFFIIWWTVLFAILPLGIRSQADEGEFTLGTERGAPGRFNLRRKVIQTTVATVLIFAAYYVATQVFGFGPNSIPQMIPDFEAKP
ncbi:DUF1467 family protein [Consotaella salsifontis]|uniref:Predicted secreted protein n=1 Tax=Consotaella salsifontis TaxID=1365950 RepID=A0A1T4LMM9_9HYPH|nr:DUF1467 family protein [Consotaella salsifontis]SJZ55975.1 Predicted secreted protein [Consotaella salsifontis]